MVIGRIRSPPLGVYNIEPLVKQEKLVFLISYK